MFDIRTEQANSESTEAGERRAGSGFATLDSHEQQDVLKALVQKLAGSVPRFPSRRTGVSTGDFLGRQCRERPRGIPAGHRSARAAAAAQKGLSRDAAKAQRERAAIELPGTNARAGDQGPAGGSRSVRPTTSGIRAASTARWRSAATSAGVLGRAGSRTKARSASSWD